MASNGAYPRSSSQDRIRSRKTPSSSFDEVRGSSQGPRGEENEGGGFGLPVFASCCMLIYIMYMYGPSLSGSAPSNKKSANADGLAKHTVLARIRTPDGGYQEYRKAVFKELKGSNRGVYCAEAVREKHFGELTCPLIEQALLHRYFFFTFVNLGWSALAKNYILNLRKALGVNSKNGVGAVMAVLDEETMNAFNKLEDREGIRIPSMKAYISGDGTSWYESGAQSIFGLGEIKFGTPQFQLLGDIKIRFLLQIVEMGTFHVVLTDPDVVWIRNPITYFQRFLDVDLLLSANSFATPLLVEKKAQVFERNKANLHVEPDSLVKGASGDISTAIMVFKGNSTKSLELLMNWYELYLPDQDRVRTKNIITWDQVALNELLRHRWKSITHDAKRNLRNADGLIWGILPMASFTNGHTFFVSRMSEQLDTPVYSVHADYTNGGITGQIARWRTAGLWQIDGPSYYNGKFVVFDFQIPESLLVPFEDIDVHFEAPDRHMQLVDFQLKQLAHALAIAESLERILVIPPFKCLCEHAWSPSHSLKCRTEGGSKQSPVPTSMPYTCPPDHIFKMTALFNQVGHRWGPRFLTDKSFPYKESEFVTMSLKSDRGKVQFDGPVTKKQMIASLKRKKFIDKPVLKLLGNVNNLFKGFDEQKEVDAFLMKIDQVTGGWCCSAANMADGLIPYMPLTEAKDHWVAGAHDITHDRCIADRSVLKATNARGRSPDHTADQQAEDYLKDVGVPDVEAIHHDVETQQKNSDLLWEDCWPNVCPRAKNLAIYKPVTASSVYGKGDAFKVTDGKHSNNVFENSARGSCAHTKNEKSWIKVDLKKEYTVTHVKLEGVVDDDEGRMKEDESVKLSMVTGWRITVGAGKWGDPVCKENANATAGDLEPIMCTKPLTGRYITVWSKNWIVLCELEAFGGDAAPKFVKWWGAAYPYTAEQMCNRKAHPQRCRATTKGLCKPRPGYEKQQTDDEEWKVLVHGDVEWQQIAFQDIHKDGGKFESHTLKSLETPSLPHAWMHIGSIHRYDENYRMHGKYQFKLEYTKLPRPGLPELAEKGSVVTIIWKQENWLSDKDIKGFECIEPADCGPKALDWDHASFMGLGKSSNEEYCIFDGNGGAPKEYNCVGALRDDYIGTSKKKRGIAGWNAEAWDRMSLFVQRKVKDLKEIVEEEREKKRMNAYAAAASSSGKRVVVKSVKEDAVGSASFIKPGTVMTHFKGVKIVSLNELKGLIDPELDKFNNFPVTPVDAISAMRREQDNLEYVTDATASDFAQGAADSLAEFKLEMASLGNNHQLRRQIDRDFQQMGKKSFKDHTGTGSRKRFKEAKTDVYHRSDEAQAIAAEDEMTRSTMSVSVEDLRVEDHGYFNKILFETLAARYEDSR
eukprot:gnl/MRDRNA2_/MRDRNA2_111843_c0_seq1.p1 gnl/MRDRNA2_/MRDRNA2_111843_c0~~gnl/MRDRNA2_/MRDRNA2_111843_c0_seq1.p1  ORF type:complete len:1376 (+),score=258.22 gnl/MRDRNA2_/MRDRNA2_111843_c0_seq1:66-4193(+)